MRRGLLIVFEGVDKAGKTTQAKLLHEYFTNVRKEKVDAMAFPSYLILIR